jgi:hypothetical protein
MQAPQVFVVRSIGDLYIVHALDSEMIQYYAREEDAIRHAAFMLRWLGHMGELLYTRQHDGVLHVSCAKARQGTWDLSEI